MKKNSKFIISTLILYFMSVAHSQSINDLESLGIIDSGQISLLQQQTSTGNQESLDNQEIIDIQDNQKAEKDEEEELDLGDPNFGYLGREDFIVESSSEEKQEALKRFGYDYFSQSPSTFVPPANAPISPDYIIGPGDEVKLILFGNNNKTYSLKVTREGDIFMPEIGPIPAAGLTFEDLQTAINGIVSNQLIGTRVIVTLGELRSINIFVLGEAQEPGMYTLSSLTTMTNAIFTSGGVKPTGSLRNIELKRNGKLISRLDLYDLLLKGDSSKDMRLMSGDVLFIPTVGKSVAATGEFYREGIFEILPNETVKDLINYAGDTRPRANLSLAKINRINADRKGFDLVSVDLENDQSNNIDLKDGDMLSIPSITDKINRAILINGHFSNKGFFPWTEGMRISELVGSQDELLPMTDADYVLIKRKNRTINGASYQFIDLNLEKYFNNPTSQNDVILKEEDEITFFPNKIYCDVKSDELLKSYEQIKEDLENALLPINGIVDEEAIYLARDELRKTRALSRPVLEILDELFEVTTASDTQTKLNAVEGISNLCRRDLLESTIRLIQNSNTKDEPAALVSILGGVKFPGSYPLTTGARIQDLVRAAGGLTELSYTSEVELIRSDFTDREVKKSIKSADYSSFSETILRPGDSVNIKQAETKLLTILLEGEVYFPGRYVIRDGETLTSVLNRAGGLTTKANIDNINFSRKSLAAQRKKVLEQASQDLIKQMTLINAETSAIKSNSSADIANVQSLLQRVSSTEEGQLTKEEERVLGRIVFDFNKISKGEQRDIELKDDDIITVPSSVQVVTVIGEVFSPNSHLINSKYTIDDYVSASGGVNDFGDIKNAYIIKGNGAVFSSDMIKGDGFFRGDSFQIEGGDSIVVPLAINTYPEIKLANEITQIIYQMAVATAAVNSL